MQTTKKSFLNDILFVGKTDPAICHTLFAHISPKFHVGDDVCSPLHVTQVGQLCLQTQHLRRGGQLQRAGDPSLHHRHPLNHTHCVCRSHSGTPSRSSLTSITSMALRLQLVLSRYLHMSPLQLHVSLPPSLSLSHPPY